MRGFLKAGHLPTLLLAFLYFDFCFAIWVLNGSMAPFIAEDFGLSPAEKGFMISVPILSGAFMRFPLGLLAQYIGRKNAALVEMGTVMVALAYGYLFVDTYPEVIVMGVLLGIAGASFGVALSLGGGWYPPKYKGLAIGIAGAGNSGAVIAVLFAPPLAIGHGWQSVYGFSVILMAVPFILMLLFAKEPPDRVKRTLGGHLKIVLDKDAWVFNISYILTFGGYIGLTTFLPTFFHDQYGIPKGQMGQYSAVIIIMASISRIAGGFLADRFGGLLVLKVLCVLVAVTSLAAATLPPVMVVTLIMMGLFLALGAGNGATFQLVPLRFPGSTAVAMSLIGEVGALGGGAMPNIMGQSMQHFGTFSYGFIVWGGVALGVLLIYLAVQRRWSTTWVGRNGKALPAASLAVEPAERPYPLIVCPVDSSELGQRALDEAAKIGGLANTAKMVLLHVVDLRSRTAHLVTDSKEWHEIYEEHLNEARNLLQKAEASLKAKFKKIEIETVLREGDIAEEIVGVARERRSDFLILSTHRYSPLRKMFTGSVIDRVSKTSPCPIVWVFQ